MKISWLDTTELEEFARSLAEEYRRALKADGGGAKKQLRQGQLLDRLLQRAADFNRKQGINVYKKAKLLDAIRSCFGEAGIPKAEAEDFVKRLMFSPLRR